MNSVEITSLLLMISCPISNGPLPSVSHIIYAKSIYNETLCIETLNKMSCGATPWKRKNILWINNSIILLSNDNKKKKN